MHYNLSYSRESFIWVAVVCYFAIFISSGFSQVSEGNQRVVVFGGTPAGLAAAISAKRSGASVTLLEPSGHVGGRFSEALGYGEAQRMDPRAIGGLWSELRQKTNAHYGELTRSPEPHVHEEIIEQWLYEEGIAVKKNFWPVAFIKIGSRLKSLSSNSGQSIDAEVFVDASYYGDLLPLAGVTSTMGRESSTEFGESLAGVILELGNAPGEIVESVYRSSVSGLTEDNRNLLPHVQGRIKDIVTGAGDDHIQCANLYACFTRDPGNRILLQKPDSYDSQEFELLKREFNRLGSKLRFGFGGYPNQKGAMNDGVPFLFHWGLVGGSDNYPTAGLEERHRIWVEHRNYTHRLFWFLQNDISVPENLRQELREWGLPKDEFVDNNHWPYGLYVREGRRMRGSYIMTQRDLFEEIYKVDSIAVGSFPVDSHVVRRLVDSDGSVVNEGGYLVKPPMYEIPFRALLPVPKECNNLVVTCAVSSSRVAFNSLRVEPTWMALGQAAGTAAALAAENGIPLGEVEVKTLQKYLRISGLPIHRPIP